jgi:prolyl-tRNA editing enzyme YbaK/EbsC (Cys-tRNA(Pro) deacylase)
MSDDTTVTDNAHIDQRVRQVLEGLGLPYEVVEIDPAYADTAQFCERYGYPMEQSANTILVGSKKEPKQYSACVVRATTRLDVNHVVRKLMGVPRLSFASAEETMALTGMMIGGVTVFALPDGLPIYVDDGLMPLDYVILGGGSRSTKIKIAPEVFRRLPGAQIISGLSQPV